MSSTGRSSFALFVWSDVTRSTVLSRRSDGRATLSGIDTVGPPSGDFCLTSAILALAFGEAAMLGLGFCPGVSTLVCPPGPRSPKEEEKPHGLGLSLRRRLRGHRSR